MDPEPPAAAPPADPGREWFWTGVPAGFIFSVVGLVLWVFLHLWLAILIVVVIVAVSARPAWRDGPACASRYLTGVFALLVPAAVVYGVVIKVVIGG